MPDIIRLYVDYLGYHPSQSRSHYVRITDVRVGLRSFRRKSTGFLISRTAQTIATLKIRCKDNTKTYFSVPQKVEILSKNRIFRVFSLPDRNKVECYESVLASVGALPPLAFGFQAADGLIDVFSSLPCQPAPYLAAGIDAPDVFALRVQ